MVLLLVVVVGALALVIGNYTQEHTGIFTVSGLSSTVKWADCTAIAAKQVYAFSKLGINLPNYALKCHNVVIGINVAPLCQLN